jgi:hypothetical protein
MLDFRPVVSSKKMPTFRLNAVWFKYSPIVLAGKATGRADVAMARR